MEESLSPLKPSLAGSELGWVSYEGGTYVTSEPMGAAVWYPVNDHPSDKATYTFASPSPNLTWWLRTAC